MRSRKKYRLTFIVLALLPLSLAFSAKVYGSGQPKEPSPADIETTLPPADGAATLPSGVKALGRILSVRGRAWLLWADKWEQWTPVAAGDYLWAGQVLQVLPESSVEVHLVKGEREVKYPVDDRFNVLIDVKLLHEETFSMQTYLSNGGTPPFAFPNPGSLPRIPDPDEIEQKVDKKM